MSRVNSRDISKYSPPTRAKTFCVLNLVYSVHGLKSIGYVQSILSTPRTIEVVPAPAPPRYLALGFAALVLIAALSFPFLRE